MIPVRILGTGSAVAGPAVPTADVVAQAETRFDTAAASILEQIRRDIQGEPLLQVVDPAAGY